ncbi:hypothetical protein V6N12_067925 [Hibiscus sabdariffa]|uniref:Uncharacterized protein n=1 Tax=Hibiscus sabdariffa TaxID=183260 RepID=A0ABR2FNQ3_9ROSI
MRDSSLDDDLQATIEPSWLYFNSPYLHEDIVSPSPSGDNQSEKPNTPPVFDLPTDQVDSAVQEPAGLSNSVPDAGSSEPQVTLPTDQVGSAVQEPAGLSNSVLDVVSSEPQVAVP